MYFLLVICEMCTSFSIDEMQDVYKSVYCELSISVSSIHTHFQVYMQICFTYLHIQSLDRDSSNFTLCSSPYCLMLKG